MAKTKGQYPAPLAALRAIREGCNLTLDEGLKVEQAAALEVMGTPISANLIGIFFMTNRLARDPGVDRPDVTPRTVAARRRRRVRADGGRDRHGARPVGHPHGDGRRRRRPPGRRDEACPGGDRRPDQDRPRDARRTWPTCSSRLSTATSHALLADADVVIEAITEDEEAKTATYRELAKVLRPDAILASNTSTISITRMAEVGPRPVAVRRDALLLPGRPDGAGRGHPRREDVGRDGGDDRRPGQAHPQDADRGPRLPGLPRQPRALALHERGA